MVSVAYGGQHPSTMTTIMHDEQPQSDEQYITFFCRALYDHQTPDASMLSFRKDDIIEVLTRLESGWWDGLIGEERGWFPSNYVKVISDQEAEAALSASELPAQQPSLADESTLDMGSSMAEALGQQDGDADWMNEQYEPTSQANTPSGYINGSGATHNDFWVPEVSQDGRIFYVNTQTGQQSRDLPTEMEEESDSDLTALSQPASRAGTSIGLHANALNGLDPANRVPAGFGIPRRSHTPEPWVRRLADDGISYFYVNKTNGQVSWTLPESVGSPAYDEVSPLKSGGSHFQAASHHSSIALASRSRAGSTASGTRDRSGSTAGYSVHSDDSGVHPIQRDRSQSSASLQKSTHGTMRSESSANGRVVAGGPDLTPSEQAARRLQQRLALPPPESPAELSEHVREAIAAVRDFMRRAPSPWRPGQFAQVDDLVLKVVSTVRHLLYVTATPSGHIPSNLYPRDGRDVRPTAAGQTLQTHLKAAHRKVAGTLSKLVLSALAMQNDPALSSQERPNRMESDLTELERAVLTFVGEVQYFQDQISMVQAQPKSPIKRLHGAFSPTYVGLGLPGAGAANTWKGFGYIQLEEGEQQQERQLHDFTQESVTEVTTAMRSAIDRVGSVVGACKRPARDSDALLHATQEVVQQLSSVLFDVSSLNVASHVDIDGVRVDPAHPQVQAQYLQYVDKARVVLRTMEASVQSLYDDCASLLVAIQSGNAPEQHGDHLAFVDYLDALTATIVSSSNVVAQTLESLLAVGFDQANIDSIDFETNIEWRKSRTITRPESIVDDDVLDLPAALSGRQRANTLAMSPAEPSRLYSSRGSESSLNMSEYSPSDGSGEPATPTTWQPEPSVSSTLVEASIERRAAYPINDPEDDPLATAKSPPRKMGGSKLLKLLGDEAPQHYVDKLNADSKPWYLRPNYNEADILLDPEGSVRAGTPAALVERLTAHEHGDTAYNQNFLMTFKSFMTVDDLFNLLVQRFWIQAPEDLTQPELEEWSRLKQSVIRLRVLNTFKTMVTDDGILEREDMHILTSMKEFASHDEVVNIGAARLLLILIERAMKGGDTTNRTVVAPLAPPAPIVPKARRIELLDIDPLELARQLTLMEATLYKKIRPMECLQRSRESKPGKNQDNITNMIQLANRMANWVAESVLSKEDSKRRAAIVKHFISVADRCRVLQNYSTMTAIISGLNTPPIRRLKRTWEHVQARAMTQLRTCETTIDSTKNFNNYRSLLARIDPPCVPFIGVYLTTLTFINDGAEDKLAGNMINFRKRQKAAEVIQDIKRWQAKPFNFQILPAVVDYLEANFSKYVDGVDYGDQFWNQSLEREPREREDEKMARLLQESGFL